MKFFLILNSFSGPAFWGLINPEWSLCNKGRRQSPVNLEPQRLLFDPNLRPLHIDKHRVSVFNRNDMKQDFNCKAANCYKMFCFNAVVNENECRFNSR